MFKILISIAIIVIDHVLLVNLLHLICPPKRNYKYLTFSIISILILENIFLWDIISLNVWTNFIPIITLLVYSIAFLSGSILKRIMSCLLIFINLIIVNSIFIIVGSIISPSVSSFIYSESNNFAYYLAIANKVLLYLEYLYLKKSLLKELELSLKIWISIISFLIVSIVSISLSLNAYINNSFSTIYTIVIIITLFLVNILVFKLCLDITKRTKEKSNQDLFIQANQYEEKILDIMQARELELRRANHDFKYHILAIEELVKNNQQVEATDYFNSLKSEHDKIEYIYTKNAVLNYLVNEKIKTAKSLNIEVRKSISGIEHDNTYISNIDINIILGNLLDNAIEGCKNVDVNKFIDIRIDIFKHKTEFTIKNSTVIETLPINSKLITSKEDKKVHGHGLSNVANAVKKYNGEITYFAKDYVFTYTCTLLNKK